MKLILKFNVLSDFQQGPPPQQANGQISDIHATNPCGFQQGMQGPPQSRGMYVINAPPPNPYIYQHAAVQP